MEASGNMSDVQAKPGQYLTFMIKGQIYGVPIGSVREINQIRDITPVPDTPGFVKGVLNLRGKVIPVVDLRVRLGIEEKGYTKETCVIVIDGRHGQVGTIVDSVSGVIDLAAENIEGPPSLGNRGKSAFVMGMGKHEGKVIILLEIVTACSFDDAAAEALAQAAQAA
jgi:purine-binding chemotaxis protein CheW